MARRAVIATLLVIIAAQLAGGMLLSAVCLEPCPDDAPGKSCPPVCSFCTSCMHAQHAIVQHSSVGVLLTARQHFVSPQLPAVPAQLTHDIFHVPLLG